MLDMVKTVHDLMRENNLYGEVYSNRDNPNIVYVDISWGDWKHDHAKLDYLVKTVLKCWKCFTTTLEQDGSDCYSARHTFVWKGEKKPLVLEEG